jgi:hypothetical protein
MRIRRRRGTQILHAFAIPVAIAAISLVTASSATAHFQTREYAFGKGCDTVKDPITILFFGTEANSANAAGTTAYLSGWNNYGGSTQYFSSHGVCTQMDTQLANDKVDQSRFHIRFNQTYHRYGPQNRYATVGTPHHEDFVVFGGCGFPGNHAVDKGTKKNPTKDGSGFDQGRRKITNIFRPLFPVHGIYWGNTRAIKQCDGDYAGSNGHVEAIRIGN